MGFSKRADKKKGEERVRAIVVQLTEDTLLQIFFTEISCYLNSKQNVYNTHYALLHCAKLYELRHWSDKL